TEALKDEAIPVRREAADALGAFGPAARPALPALTERLQDQDGEVSLAAAEAIASVDVMASAATVQAYTQLVKRGGPSVRRTAIRHLQSLGAKARDAVPALVEARTGPDREVREAAARALKAIDPEAAERGEVLALRADLKDEKAEVRCEAAGALGK